MLEIIILVIVRTHLLIIETLRAYPSPCLRDEYVSKRFFGGNIVRLFKQFPPDWGMLRRSRCIQIFLLKTGNTPKYLSR